MSKLKLGEHTCSRSSSSSSALIGAGLRDKSFLHLNPLLQPFLIKLAYREISFQRTRWIWMPLMMVRTSTNHAIGKYKPNQWENIDLEKVNKVPVPWSFSWAKQLAINFITHCEDISCWNILHRNIFCVLYWPEKELHCHLGSVLRLVLSFLFILSAAGIHKL